MADEYKARFPLIRDLMEGDEFRKWPPGERLYYLRLIDEANERHGETFYMSDLRLAAELGISERTIRRARSRAKKLGWLDFVPGRVDLRGNHLATTYHRVQWAMPEPGQAYCLVSRWLFRIALDFCRDKALSPADVVVYMALAYWQWKHREAFREVGGFYISKSKLRELTGLQDAPKRVGYIASAFKEAGWQPFKVADSWHHLNILGWGEPPGPGTSEKVTEYWRRRESEIEAAVERERQRRLVRLVG